MFKKILMIFCACAMCLTLGGCSSSQQSVANEIQSQVAKLEKVVRGVENIENKQIIIEDVSKKYNKLSANNEQTVQAPKGYEILYTNCQKALEQNNDLLSLKNQLLECCNLLNALTRQLKKNEIKLSQEQINGCKECLANITEACNEITLTKHDVNKEVKSVSKSLKSYQTNASVVSSKYIKLTNALQNRITTYQNALNLLNQLKCIISGTCSQSKNNSISKTIDGTTDNSSFIVDQNGNKHESYCDGNKNCYTPKKDADGNCYYENQNGKIYYVICENGVCYYPHCDADGTCKYFAKNGNILPASGARNAENELNNIMEKNEIKSQQQTSQNKENNTTIEDENFKNNEETNQASESEIEKTKKDQSKPENKNTTEKKNYDDQIQTLPYYGENDNIKIIENKKITPARKYEIINDNTKLNGQGKNNENEFKNKKITNSENGDVNIKKEKYDKNEKLKNIDTYKDPTFTPNVNTYKNSKKTYNRKDFYDKMAIIMFADNFPDVVDGENI